MEQLSERLQTPISTAELERRWAAVRAAMERDKIDVLLMQNNNDHMGGYVKYFTDLPATNGYPLTVVFPRDDLMTMVSQGPFGGVNATRRQERRHAPRRQALVHDAELLVLLLHRALRSRTRGQGACALCRRHDRPRRHLSDVVRDGRLSCRRGASPTPSFVDASDLVDRIKVIKSPEEQELVRRAPAMQDGAMRAAFAAVEPGMRDRDIAAIAQCYSQRHGSENGIYLCASMPPGKPAQFASAIIRTASSRKATRLRCWSRIPAPAACTPSSAAPASSARPRRRSRTSIAFALEARKYQSRPAQARRAVQGHLRRL